MATTKLDEALAKLDAKNDEHWTADGLPRMDVVHELTGDSNLTRADLNKRAAKFNRESLSAEPGGTPKPGGEGSTSEDPGKAALRDGETPLSGSEPGASGEPTAGEGGTDPEHPNPTQPGETGADEELGDKTVGLTSGDPDDPAQGTVDMAGEGDRQDADGTETASAENERNEGRADQPTNIDVDGGETASRENEELLPNADMPAPLDADGSVTSNRQVNEEDEARRAGFPRDTADEFVEELERTDPTDASDDDDKVEADLNEQLEEADAALAEAEADLQRLRTRAARIQAQRDAIVERRDRNIDRLAPMRERMHFIGRQAQMRAERAGDLRAAEEHAERLRGIAGSALDRSMARDTRRGKDRPMARPRRNVGGGATV